MGVDGGCDNGIPIVHLQHRLSGGEGWEIAFGLIVM
jgi:hypothetical protein